MFDMRTQIYEHLQRLDLRFYDRNPVGRLMTRVTTDVDVINDLFTSGVVSIFGDVFTLAGIMIVHAVDELAAGARHVRRPAADRPGHAVVPAQRARVVPDGAAADRPHQRLPAGAHHRHVDGAAVPPRGARLRAVRRDQRGAPDGQRRLDLLLRRVLPGDRGGRRAGRRADDLVRRPVGAPGRPDARVARRLPALLAALLPADLRHVGEVQHPAGRDGLLGAHLQAARRAGDDSESATAGRARSRRAGVGAEARSAEAATSSSITSGSPTARRRRGESGLRPAGRVLRGRDPASASASSARPARASPR